MAARTRILSLALAGLLMSSGAIGADPDVQDGTPVDGSDGACLAPLTFVPEPPSSTIGTDRTQDRSDTWLYSGAGDKATQPLDRRWKRIARSPFGGAYSAHAWAGTEMLVMQDDTGRLASYDPVDDSWVRRRKAPRPPESFGPSVWTGTELVIPEIAPHGESIGGLAYAPASDTWRELRRSPFRMVDGLADATWTGARLVAIDGARNAAAYDPVADCWDQLPQVPGEWSGSHVYWSGSELLGETRRGLEKDGLSIATFDPDAGTWGEPVPSPLLRDASPAGAVWVDGRLVYVSWTHTDGYEGPWDAIYDPADATWTVFEHHCRTSSFGSIGAGGLIFSEDGRRAFDPRTAQCYRISKPPVRTGAGAARVWTGRELIFWSGVLSLPVSPKPRGMSLRPPARFIEEP